MVRMAGGVRLMRMGGSTIMISPSLGCGYFLKSWRQTRCGSSNRSAGRDTGALGICAWSRSVTHSAVVLPGARASTMAYMSLMCRERALRVE